jgi:hypothetical protein
MRATAPRFACGAVVCAAGLLLLGGAGAADVRDASAVVFTMSQALQQSNPARFLAQVDRRRFAAYGALERSVAALCAQYEISSSIEVIDAREENGALSLTVDWLLQTTPASAPGPAQRRQEKIHCRLEQIEGKWKVTALAPVEFFSALQKR